ncbi:MAG TPA: tetratricopeptide repeat protein [Burkholderiaceae bacterium]|nr:tetratricopeptide repeat protein [Burkholderiaceae bacterium]
MSDHRALLLTDVVDSTKLSLRIGDGEMARLWAAHDRAARDLLPAFRGREIDKTDGMLLMFDAASDAVGYAIAYQRALSELVPQMAARAGLHVGPVTLRENSASDVARGAKPLEVEGVAKATAARVMSVASGGQILLSADAGRSLGEGGFRLQSHGHWRLKGLDEPIELFEVGDDRAHFSPPPDADKAYRVVRQGDVWTPVREIRHSLPAERDSFVGRAEDLFALWQRIQAGARLLSVLGLGGTGKTRLVARFGRNWLGEFPGGIWFCDLAPARSLDGVVSAVAQGLDVPLGRDDPVVQLGHAIAGRGRCAVILDNFEQVVQHAQATVGRWLDRAEQACFVVTTREVLGLAGEDVLALPPLPPADGAALFVQRAEAARPDFHPGPDDQAAIAPLVALLDGLPLAIELAAARVRVMPPRALLLRMSERFKLLTSKGSRLDRQATLRAAFDWSWDLLPLAEKAALSQLSLFEGGFTLEAAEAVIDLTACCDAPWTVDVVQALVDKSFVRSRGDGRFDLLVSVQAYAAEHLQTVGRYQGSGPQALAAARSRHLAWYAALGPVRATEGYCADLDNLVAACRCALEAGDGDAAAGALEGAWAALALRGPLAAGVELAERVCAMPRLSDRGRAHASLALAHALAMCGRTGPARAGYDRALACASAAGDRECEAWATFRLGSLHQLEGHIDDARSRQVDAIAMARALGERRLECLAASGLGNLALIEGHMDEALSQYTQGLAVAPEAGDRNLQGYLLGNLGKLHLEVGHLDEAHARFGEALAIARETGERRLEGNMLCNLGMVRLVQERVAESEAASKAALVVARELGNLRLECIVLCNLGIVLERLGDAGEAQTHFEAAVRLAHSLGDPLSEGEFLGYLGLLHARQGRPGEARTCLESGEALLRGVSDQFGLGVLLSSRAEAHHLAGDAAAAIASLAAASAIAAEVGAGPTSEIGLALARVTRLIASPRG